MKRRDGLVVIIFVCRLLNLQIAVYRAIQSFSALNNNAENVFNPLYYFKSRFSYHRHHRYGSGIPTCGAQLYPLLCLRKERKKEL